MRLRNIRDGGDGVEAHDHDDEVAGSPLNASGNSADDLLHIREREVPNGDVVLRSAVGGGFHK